MIRHFAIAGLALALVACAPEAAGEQADAPTPEDTAVETQAAFGPADLIALIDRLGPEGALQDLLADPMDMRWPAAMTGIGLGEQAWLDTVPRFQGALDGEAATSTYAALAQALEHNPEPVLRLASADGSLETVCYPDIPETTAAKIAALEALPDSDMTAYRDECVRWLMQEPT